MAYTLGEAARATGKSKPAISKAIKTGRLSAGRADDGSYRIDPSELHRVYPLPVNGAWQGRRDETPVNGQLPGDELVLWRTLATEREDMIRDLRHRLDASEAERRQLSERLHGLLATSFPEGKRLDHSDDASGPAPDIQDGTVPNTPLAGFRPRWWRRWLR